MLVGRILAAADIEGGGDAGAAFWAVPDAAGEGRRSERDRGRPPTHVVAARFPGVLTHQALRRMDGHMRGVAMEDLLGGPPLLNVIRAYLVTNFFGARPEAAVGLRNARELKTIAAIVEAILQGRVLSALDIAVQRFKAIELSIEEGNWTNARWLELIPVNTVGTYDRADLRDARREEEQDRRATAPRPRRRSRSSSRTPSRSRSRRRPPQARGPKGKGKGGREAARGRRPSPRRGAR